MYFESNASLPSTRVRPAHPMRRFQARKWCGGVARLILLFVIFAPVSSAQVSATLAGAVTDQSGATVSGAAVTVKDLETGAIRNTTTGEAGQYQVFSLPIGEYEVRVTKQGFAEQIRTGIRLVVGQDARVDVTLSSGTREPADYGELGRAAGECDHGRRPRFGRGTAGERIFP